jgi:hypothetical protein
MTKYAVAILLALTLPASAQDTTTANQMLPGCKGLLDNSMSKDVAADMLQVLCTEEDRSFVRRKGCQSVRRWPSSSSTSKQGQRGCTSLLLTSPSKR